MGYEFHEAANIFPMEEESLDSLAEDIQENDLQIPIETCGGKIIDGRRRYLACLRLGVEPDVVVVDPKDPIAYVLSLNLHRRHLDASQKSMVAARARGMYDEAAKERKREGQKAGGRGRKKNLVENSSPSNGQKSRDAAGAAVGVSGFSVDAATKVLKKGVPELQQAVDKGTIKVSTAARLADAPKVTQREAIKGGKAAVRAAIERHAPSPTEEAQNDAGVKWHKAMHDIRSRLISTRELGGILELTKQWTPALIEQYRDDISDLIQELEQWKKALTSTLKKR